MILFIVITDSGRHIIGEIYDTHHKRMLYIATQILGKEDAEEAVHDIFVKLIEKSDNDFSAFTDKPGQYFVIIAKNHSLNILKQARLKYESLEDESMSEVIVQSNSGNPENILLNEENIEVLARHIRCLSPAARQILEYRFIEGYSNIEIADLLNISQSAVSTRINKAKTSLKEKLENGGAASDTN